MTTHDNKPQPRSIFKPPISYHFPTGVHTNLVFSEWDKLFKDPVTTAAAIDRLVHHSIILELDGDSYRMQHAKNKKQKGND